MQARRAPGPENATPAASAQFTALFYLDAAPYYCAINDKNIVGRINSTRAPGDSSPSAADRTSTGRRRLSP